MRLNALQHGIILFLIELGGKFDGSFSCIIDRSQLVYQRTEGDVALVTFPFRDGFVEKSRLKFAKLKRIYGDQISKLIY